MKLNDKIKNLFKNRVFRIILIVILLVVSLLVYLGNGIKTDTMTVEKGKAEEYATSEGQIRLGTEYHIISEVTGAISEICVSENDEVKKGDIIIKIDPVTYETQLAAAENSLAVAKMDLAQIRMERIMTTSPDEYIESIKQSYEYAKAAYDSATTSFEADKQLYSAGLISKYEYEASKAAYEEAKLECSNASNRYDEAKLIIESLTSKGYTEENLNDAFYVAQEEMIESRLKAEEDNVELQKKLLDKCSIRAYKDGKVAAVSVKNQSVINIGEEAAVINCYEDVHAEADVLTTIAPYIQKGTPVTATISLKGENEVYSGTVEEIYDYASQGTSVLGLKEYRVHVKVKLDADDGLKFRDGYGATLKFKIIDKDDCLTIPVNAMFSESGKDYVYCKTEQGCAEKREITVSYKGSSCVVVGSGLSEGDVIVSNCSEKGLKEGVKLK